MYMCTHRMLIVYVANLSCHTPSTKLTFSTSRRRVLPIVVGPLSPPAHQSQGLPRPQGPGPAAGGHHSAEEPAHPLPHTLPGGTYVLPIWFVCVHSPSPYHTLPGGRLVYVHSPSPYAAWRYALLASVACVC